MIIPPDPEKDPRLFRESTASLVTVPEDQLVDVDDLLAIDNAPTLPQTAYTLNPAAPVAYPYGPGPFSDAFSVPYDPVPPYSARRELDPVEHAAYGGGQLARSFSRASRGSSSSSASGSSTSTNATPPPRRRYSLLRRGTGSTGARTTSTPATSDAALASSSESSRKPWEGLVVGGGAERRRWMGIPIPPRPNIPISPEAKTLWRKYRKWWIALLLFLAVGVVLAVGLAAGLVLSDDKEEKRHGDGDPWKGNRKGQNSSYGTTPDMNITYVPKRDGPKPEDGEMSNCNQFTQLNASSVLTQLAVNSPYFSHYISTFDFPLNSTHNGMASLDHNLYVIARGLAATGTVEIVGSNAPEEVIGGGKEGVVKIDVLARYAVGQDLEDVANVCQMTREDGSSGIGIFTPTETVGGAEGPFLLDPMLTPAFHVIIRLPPSLIAAKNNTVGYLPGLSLELAQMGTRVGNLEQVAVIGDFKVQAGCRGGGVVVDYASCETCTIVGAENTVQGTFNVTHNLQINSTSGTILANVILSDPGQPGDESATITSTIPMPHGAARKRSLLGRGTKIIAPSEAKYPPLSNLSAESGPTHSVNTTFSTNEGFIFIAYLHHPPSTALRSYISSQSGMVDVSMHPNYVGAFALENMWGGIRLPPIQAPASPDPKEQGRSRVVLQGPVDLNSTMFSGVSSDDLKAPNSVTGAAAWAWSGKAQPTVQEVQYGLEGRGSALVACANLGDLQVTFDGT